MVRGFERTLLLGVVITRGAGGRLRTRIYSVAKMLVYGYLRKCVGIATTYHVCRSAELFENGF